MKMKETLGWKHHNNNTHKGKKEMGRLARYKKDKAASLSRSSAATNPTSTRQGSACYGQHQHPRKGTAHSFACLFICSLC